MTSGAWLMMLATWTIVIGFTLRFFLRVLVTPIQEEDFPNSKP